MASSDRILNIFDENHRISSLFTKTNAYLISTYRDVLERSASDQEKTAILEQLWYEVFKARFIKDNGQYQRLIFDDTTMKSLFFLKMK